MARKGEPRPSLAKLIRSIDIEPENREWESYESAGWAKREFGIDGFSPQQAARVLLDWAEVQAAKVDELVEKVQRVDPSRWDEWPDEADHSDLQRAVELFRRPRTLRKRLRRLHRDHS